MTSSFKISIEKVEEIKQYYKDYEIENNNDLILFQCKYNNCNNAFPNRDYLFYIFLPKIQCEEAVEIFEKIWLCS